MMSASTPAVLTLYHRSGCHLCEMMQSQLELLRQRFNFCINMVDIDEDQVLLARFRTKIPVLALGQEIICCHFLDEEELKHTLEHV